MPTDSEQIASLLFTYAERIDAGDLEGLAALFTHATLRSHGRPGARKGRDEVLRLYRETVQLHDGTPRTKHVTTNLVVEVDAAREQASARSMYTVFQALPDFPLQAIVAGRYHDRFVRSDGIWRFEDRLIFVDLVGDLSRHLTRSILT